MSAHFKSLSAAGLLSTLVLGASAATMGSTSGNTPDQFGQIQTVALSDGGTLHIFQNGKMALENKFGNVGELQAGQQLQTRDGRTLTASGNETARLAQLLHQDSRH